MPALPNADHALKCTYQGSYLATNWVNVFYLQYAGTTPVDADLATIATGLRTAWNATLGSIQCNQVILTKTTVMDVSRNPGAYGENNTAATASGGTTGFPANVAVAISKKVARRYRGGHPRLYMTGTPTTASSDGKTILTATLAGWNTTVAAWLTQVNALTTASTGAVKLANVGYYFVSPPKTPPQIRPVPVVELIVSVSINSRLDTQRRRLGKK